MTVEPPLFLAFGHETVEVLHAEGAADEKRFSLEAHGQPYSDYGPSDTPTYEGDIIKIKDPHGVIERKLVSEVITYDPKGVSFRGGSYTESKWGRDPQARSSPVRCLTIENYPLLSCRQQDSFHIPRWSGATSERNLLLIYSCASVKCWTAKSATSAKLSRQLQKGAIK